MNLEQQALPPQEIQRQAVQNELQSFEAIQYAQQNLEKQETLVYAQIEQVKKVIADVKELRTQLEEITDLPIRFPLNLQHVVAYMLKEYKK